MALRTAASPTHEVSCRDRRSDRGKPFNEKEGSVRDRIQRGLVGLWMGVGLGVVLCMVGFDWAAGMSLCGVVVGRIEADAADTLW